MEHNVQTLIWIDKSDLPPEALSLTDPDTPLPEGTVLFDTAPGGPGFVLHGIGFAFLVICLVAFAVEVPGAFEKSDGEGVGT